MIKRLEFQISNRSIGPSQRPYIVAELSGNHNGSLEQTLKLIEAAKISGADAVKIQTYTPDTITIDHSSDDFLVKDGLWAGRRLYDLYEEAHTPWDWHEKIFSHGKKLGITIFSSPFDGSAVKLLESFNCPAYKIASPEIIDLSLIRRVAETQKPMIISTGAATFDEIEEALVIARAHGTGAIALLHCTAAYPARLEDADLVTINELERRFEVVTGLSDHTLGTLISEAAVSVGASVIEKHFTLDRSDGGIDSDFSIEPHELRQLCERAKLMHIIRGKPAYSALPAESTVLKNRRSLYVVSDIKAGEAFTAENVRSIRPGFGLKPKFLDAVLGRKASRDISFGQALRSSMIEGGL